MANTMLSEGETKTIRDALKRACGKFGCSVRAVARLLDKLEEANLWEPKKRDYRVMKWNQGSGDRARTSNESWIENAMYTGKRITALRAYDVFMIAADIAGDEAELRSAAKIIEKYDEVISGPGQPWGMVVIKGQSIKLADALIKRLESNGGTSSRLSAQLRQEVKAFFDAFVYEDYTIPNEPYETVTRDYDPEELGPLLVDVSLATARLKESDVSEMVTTVAQEKQRELIISEWRTRERVSRENSRPKVVPLRSRLGHPRRR